MDVLSSTQPWSDPDVRPQAPWVRPAVLLVLLAVAVIALGGYLPGAAPPAPSQATPTAVTVVLAPVLFTVAVVILLAGVLAGAHQLPLAFPDRELAPEPRRWGRPGVWAIAVLAVVLLLFGGLFAFAAFRARTSDTGGTVDSGPAKDPGEGAPVPDDPGTGPGDGFTGTAATLITLAAAVLLGLAAATLILAAVRTRGPRGSAPTEQSVLVHGTESLARVAELGLAAMNVPGQDPRTAIIACYLAMERGLSAARSAAPLASDTPMEVLARGFAQGALHDAAARELVALFEEARFSPHAMAERQRIRAEQLLRVVLADLRAVR